MSAKTPESITLDHSIEIYIPTQCRCGQLLPDDVRAEVLDEVKGAMHGWFGGVSKKDDIRVEEIEGAWPLKSGEIANERVDVVYSNASAEALEEHFEELPALAASIANRLTQESIAFRVDNKMTLMPGQDVKPHRCAGGVSPGALPVARQPNEKERMRAIQASLQRISSIRDARDLFCNVLHYDFEDEQIHTVQWPDKLKEYLAPRTSPQIIAHQNGFKILYLQLAEDYLRKGHERQVVQRIIKDDPTLRGLVVVSDIDQKKWHLVNAKFEKEDGKKERLRLRRMRVGPEQSVRTAVERLKDVDVEHLDEGITAAQLQDLHDNAFDVESVSKDFFNEISNWYFWALTQVEFPDDMVKDGDDEKHRATSLIRFLTRIIFCWFLKEKNLIPDSLFKEKDLFGILKDLDPDSCSYHQGILQNLFFATLNQRMGKDSKGQPYRAFAKDEGFPKNKSTYGVDTLYRYEEHFKDENKALSYFADVPFLNGGLFECLDRTDEDTGKKLYVDGFSRNKKKRARVPNELFFAGEQIVDLSVAYGDPRRHNAKVRGLLNILHAYNFTVEENTPIDEEIALDPELLGKVFENLLASYNEETKTTARRQTGSFYTPRPIVEYMVDESLKAHLTGALTALGRAEAEAHEQLDLLLGYADEGISFSEEEISTLLEAIHTCKILDPACGSGAFPIGMLQKLVHIVYKLDPENDKFEAIQIREAQKIQNRDERRKQIEQIGKDFSENEVDYGRKLYLIENCLYGVDIQPIAIQISKLRFFISLICDQKTNRDKAKNHGIRALPNLETKFVVANTLIGLPEMDQMALVDPRVNAIEAEIETLYHRHFSIQRRDQKIAIQKKLKKLREELGIVLAQSLGSSQKAEHVAEWDPFDSQASADFFDPHWMFGKELSDGFDIVIGNPPYLRIQGIQQASPKTADYYRSHYTAATGSFDLYVIFIERGVQLMSKNGILNFINPDKWVNASFGKGIRHFAAQNRNVHRIISFGAHQVFSACTYSSLLWMRNSPVDSIQYAKVSPNEDREVSLEHELSGLDASAFARIPFENLSEDPWILPAPHCAEAMVTIQKHKRTVGEVFLKMFQGIASSKDAVYFLKNAVFSGNTCEAFSQQLNERIKIESDFVRPLLMGDQVHRFEPIQSDTVVVFPYDDSGNNRPNILSPTNIRQNYPLAWEYLGRCEQVLRARENGRFEVDEWYQFGRKQGISEGSIAKLLAPDISLGGNFSFDFTGNHYTTTTLYGYIKHESVKESYEFLLGILNSKVLWFYLKNSGSVLANGYYRYKPAYLKNFPVPEVSRQHEEILASLVQCMLKLKQFSARNSAAIRFLDELIDACVMECYFGAHMAERDLLFLDDLGSHLSGYNSDASEAKQLDFLGQFHRTLNASGSKFRDRLDRICKDSPDLLAVIKEAGEF